MNRDLEAWALAECLKAGALEPETAAAVMAAFLLCSNDAETDEPGAVGADPFAEEGRKEEGETDASV